MKTQTIKTFAVLITAFAALTTLNSCQKEKAPSTSTTTATAPFVSPYDLAGPAFFDGLSSIMSNNTKNFKTQSAEAAFGSCGTLTVDTTTLPYTSTWNFGTGCTGSDGNTRSGEITVSINSRNPKVANDTATITFINYVFDTMEYNGTIQFTTYTDGSGYLNYVLSLNTTITLDAIAYPTTGSLNFQWIQGINNANGQNLQFSITGALSSFDKQKNPATATVSNPLIWNKNTTGCNYIIQGTIQVVDNGNDETYDFGTGDCSGIFTEVVGGKTFIKHQ